MSAHKVDYSKCPLPNLAAGLQLYLEHGIQPGTFLARVLQNDLEGAVLHANPHSFARLGELVLWMVREVPLSAWGSRDTYEHVVSTGGYHPVRAA